MEIKSNKPGIARSVTENRGIAEARNASSAQSASAAVHPDLKEGQTVKGQVLDLRYNEVRIRLQPGGQTITAKLAGEVPLSIGEEAHFEVSESTAGQLILKYLPENTTGTSIDQTALDAAVMKALTASGFSLNERNKAIAAELLIHRMPVDKQTLQALIKAAVMNQEASPSSLVILHKNNILLTPANIKQFEAYQNGTGQLLKDIRNIITNLGKLLTPQNEVVPADPKSSKAAIADPAGATASESAFKSGPSAAPGQNSLSTLGTSAVFPQLLQLNSSLLGLLEGSLNNTENAIPMSAMNINELISKNVESGTPDNTAKVISTIASADIITIAAPQIPNIDHPITGYPYEYNSIAGLTGSDGGKELLHLLQGLQEDSSNEAAQFYQRLEEGNASAKDLLTLIHKQLPQLQEEDAVKLILAPEYHKLLEQAFHDRWTLTPEKLADKASVDRLYQALQEDMDKLGKLISSTQEQQTSAQFQEPVKNLQENLQFMRSLNEIFPYIQLPIQLREQEVHGELYVYTNKKAPRDKENISVLLHLEMERLGSMNIHLQMDHNIISAIFYMEQPEAEQLFRDHMPTLMKTLEKKGYSLHSVVSGTYKKTDLIKDFIEDSTLENDVSRFTFDIRT